MVIDLSEDNDDLWTKTRIFIKNLIDKLPISTERIRLGAVTAAPSPSVRFYLNQHNAAYSKFMIDMIDLPTGYGDLGKTFELVDTAIFNISQEDRIDVPNILLLITDGVSLERLSYSIYDSDGLVISANRQTTMVTNPASIRVTNIYQSTIIYNNTVNASNATIEANENNTGNYSYESTRITNVTTPILDEDYINSTSTVAPSLGNDSNATHPTSRVPVERPSTMRITPGVTMVLERQSTMRITPEATTVPTPPITTQLNVSHHPSDLILNQTQKRFLVYVTDNSTKRMSDISNTPVFSTEDLMKLAESIINSSPVFCPKTTTMGIISFFLSLKLNLQKIFSYEQLFASLIY